MLQLKYFAQSQAIPSLICSKLKSFCIVLLETTQQREFFKYTQYTVVYVCVVLSLTNLCTFSQTSGENITWT